MNKKILFSFLTLLISVPIITTAQTADVDPQGSSSCVSISNNLRYRTTDAQTSGDVSVLQDFLQANGYLKASPSGYMGLLTVKGVKAFQSANGISPTGYVGPLTRAKIQAASCAGTTVNIPINSTSNNQNGPTQANGCITGAMFSTTTGARCQNISVTDNDLSKDASIKQAVAAARAQAELFYSSTNNAYSDVCSTTRTHSIAKLASQAEESSGQKSTCLSNATSWALSVPLKSKPNVSFCSDNYGYSDQGRAVNLNGTNSCGEVMQTSAPTITSIQSPSNPSGTVDSGRRAYIYGTGLKGRLTIKIGNQEPQYVTVDNSFDTSAEFTFPYRSSTSIVSVIVTNDSGKTSNSYDVSILSY